MPPTTRDDAARRNPVGTHVKVGVDAAFRSACADEGVRVLIHAPYLVNLGSPTPATYRRSVATIAHNLSRAVEVGAEGVVIHTGSCVDDGSHDAAMRQVREGLLPVLETSGSRDEGDPDTPLLKAPHDEVAAAVPVPA